MSEPRIERLTTERMVLTIATPADSAALREYRLLNRAHIEPWEPKREEEFFSVKATEERVASWNKEFHAKEGWYWLMRLHGDDRIIGYCAFACPVRGVMQAVHLGYSIGAEHQGKGLMPEALRATTAYAFEQEGFHRVLAYYMPNNTRSAKVLQKVGFERDGYAREYCKVNGKWEDHILTSLINTSDKN